MREPPSSHELLAEQVKMKLCPAVHSTKGECGEHKCSDTGFVLNLGDPLFEALWLRCFYDIGTGLHGEGCDANCDGSGYVRRSREDVWYRLAVLASLEMWSEAIGKWSSSSQYAHPLDALCAVIIQARKREEAAHAS